MELSFEACFQIPLAILCLLLPNLSCHSLDVFHAQASGIVDPVVLIQMPMFGIRFPMLQKHISCNGTFICFNTRCICQDIPVPRPGIRLIVHPVVPEKPVFAFGVEIIVSNPMMGWRPRPFCTADKREFTWTSLWMLFFKSMFPLDLNIQTLRTWG